MQGKKMKIGILVAGHVPDEMQGKFGDYDQVFSRYLADDRLEFVAFNVVDGVFPQSIDDADGWLITGSKYGVYEGHDWIEPLAEFVRKLDAAKRPLVGVCFGHQMIAYALGGTVEKYDGGWIAGPAQYQRSDLGREQEILAWHQDQVIEKPEIANVIGSATNCEFAILRYGNHILSYQAHPEFTPEFVKDLQDARKGLLPENMEKNVASACEVVDRPYLAEEIKDHFLKAAAQAA